MTEDLNLLTPLRCSNMVRGDSERSATHSTARGTKPPRTERNLWRQDEVFALLRTMQETYALERLNDKSMKSDIVFKDIEEAMFEKGFRKKSAIQIATKWKLLKSTYTTSRRDGVIPRIITPDIYSELHNMLKHCNSRRKRKYENGNTNWGYSDHFDDSSNFLPPNSATSSRHSAEQSNGDGSVQSMIISRVEGGFGKSELRDEDLPTTADRTSTEPPNDLNVAHPIFGYKLGLVKTEPYEEMDTDNEEQIDKRFSPNHNGNQDKNITNHFGKSDIINESTSKLQSGTVLRNFNNGVNQKDKSIGITRVAQWLPQCQSNGQRYNRYRKTTQMLANNNDKSPLRSPSRRSSPLLRSNRSAHCRDVRRRMSSPINTDLAQFVIIDDSKSVRNDETICVTAGDAAETDYNPNKEILEKEEDQSINYDEQLKEITLNKSAGIGIDSKTESSAGENDKEIERNDILKQNITQSSIIIKDTTEKHPQILQNGVNCTKRIRIRQIAQNSNQRLRELKQQKREKMLLGEISREFAMSLRAINQDILEEFVNSQKEIMLQGHKIQMQQMQIIMDSFQKQTLSVLKSIGTMIIQNNQQQQNDFFEMRKNCGCCCHRHYHTEYDDLHSTRYPETKYRRRKYRDYNNKLFHRRDVNNKYRQRYSSINLPKFSSLKSIHNQNLYESDTEDEEEEERFATISDESSNEILSKSDNRSSDARCKLKNKRTVLPTSFLEKSKDKNDQQSATFVHLSDESN